MTDARNACNAGALADQHGLILNAGTYTVSDMVCERPVALYAPAVVKQARIGAYTYVCGGAKCSNLVVGRYCSLASNLCVGLDTHPVDRFSTFPFTSAANPFWKTTSTGQLDTPWTESASPFNSHSSLVTIGNDVWIGSDVVIPAAREITVGHGAIVGACSVLTRDVPPYCIAAGNPARVVRQRFSDSIVADLLASQWWGYDLPACLAANSGLADSKFMRAPDLFLSWWQGGGRELLQRFPLKSAWRKVTLDHNGVRVSLP